MQEIINNINEGIRRGKATAKAKSMLNEWFGDFSNGGDGMSKLNPMVIEAMKNVVGVKWESPHGSTSQVAFDTDPGLLVISTSGPRMGSIYAQEVDYEILDEIEAEEWLKEMGVA